MTYAITRRSFLGTLAAAPALLRMCERTPVDEFTLEVDGFSPITIVGFDDDSAEVLSNGAPWRQRWINGWIVAEFAHGSEIKLKYRHADNSLLIAYYRLVEPRLGFCPPSIEPFAFTGLKSDAPSVVPAIDWLSW